MLSIVIIYDACSINHYCYLIHLLFPVQTELMETLKTVRASKEPLTEVKNTLQEDINSCNKAINAVSEEVTFLKQKVCMCVYFSC